MVATPLLLAAILAVVSANPLGRRTMEVHEKRNAVPSRFVQSGSVPASKEITLRIALTNTDIAGLEKTVYEISDPANALYGQHLTPEQVAEFVKPTAEGLAAVTEWLSENDISPKSVSNAGDLLQITIPASKADELLSTKFSTFKHVESGVESIRTLAYSVPASLKPHIQFVHPTIAFTAPLGGPPGVTAINTKRALGQEKRKDPVEERYPASCATVVTPACLQAFYGIPTAKATSSANNVLGVAGYVEQFANQADLQRFLGALRPDLVNTTFSLQTIDGGTNDQTLANSGGEAVLDIEYTVGLAGGVPVTFISVGEDNNDGVMGALDIVTSLLGETDEARPTVLTTSYGFNEEDVTIALSRGVCQAYMQLGAVGTSVLFASGDGGVGGSDFQQVDCTMFVPAAPSGCPFITSVGGSVGLPPQVAANFSSGGFSNYFTVPYYQANDVSTYVASIGDQYAGLFNTNGRGYPDIAAQAESVEIAWKGNFTLVKGTSAASPISASIFALVNDKLIAAGKPVLGFLNPFLYSAAGRAAFTDVTYGTNPGCNTDGFSASTGWDPVTGLGTPNYKLLLTAVGLDHRSH
ncbi:peptidase S8/S53 domain-containing protein [Mycena rosella]|uniref:Peptidase S8/S53 domain-containing protein n=1 Tax=Mycena rosella TaxID=1033263 RepID=A0AAD7GEI6_MYCRO|nr:peptidase S8/S53 domain-containing protein [Mycena rosella]